MIAAAREVVAVANILKIGEDELQIITGIADTDAALEAIWHRACGWSPSRAGLPAPTILTLAARVSVQGIAVKVVDTTGCGDSFMAAFLTGLLDSEMDVSAESLAAIGRFACCRGGDHGDRAGRDGCDADPRRARGLHGKSGSLAIRRKRMSIRAFVADA